MANEAPSPAAHTAVLVEGESDRNAVLALARRSGRNLADEGIAVVTMGGVTNVDHHVRRWGPAGLGIRLLGLCDRPEAPYFERAFTRASLPTGAGGALAGGSGFFVCCDDLEDELIRALGVEAIVAFIEASGELRAFRTLQRQPAQRDRTVEQQLHRFIGTRSGRKRSYGGGLVARLASDAVPRPLADLLACL